MQTSFDFLTITGSGSIEPLDPAAASPAQLAERALYFARTYDEARNPLARTLAAQQLAATLDAFNLREEWREYIQALRLIEAAGLLGVAAEAYCAVQRSAYARDPEFLAARWATLISPNPWDAEDLPFTPEEEVHAA